MIPTFFTYMRVYFTYEPILFIKNALRHNKPSCTVLKPYWVLISRIHIKTDIWRQPTRFNKHSQDDMQSWSWFLTTFNRNGFTIQQYTYLIHTRISTFAIHSSSHCSKFSVIYCFIFLHPIPNHFLDFWSARLKNNI